MDALSLISRHVDDGRHMHEGILRDLKKNKSKQSVVFRRSVKEQSKKKKR